MERDNLIEQAQALNAAVAAIKEYCDGRTADDACRKRLFRDNCGGEPYTWGGGGMLRRVLPDRAVPMSRP